jgi:macrodomain Ter protein organizer (MatP/YcbG family)
MTNAKEGKRDATRQLSVRFDLAVVRALEEIARRQRRTLSDELRYIVDRAIERHGEERAA